MVGKSPDMMSVMALADLAAGVFTTCNSLSHYCAAKGKPAIVVGNRPLMGTPFETNLRVRGVRLFDWEANLFAVTQACMQAWSN